MSNPNHPSKLTRLAVGALALSSAATAAITAGSPEFKPERRTPVVATHPKIPTSTTTTSEYVQVGSQELENGVLKQQLDEPQAVPTTVYRGEPGTKPNADVDAWKQALDGAQSVPNQAGVQIGDAAVQMPGQDPQVRQG